MTDGRRIRIDALDAFCRHALSRVGIRPEHARIAADALTTTDSWGVFTHGVKLLPGYVRRARAGGIRCETEPTIVADGPAWAIVDGGTALGQVVGVFAMKEAVARARRTGIAYVGVKNSNHFGAAGYYAVLAAREGLLGLAMANDAPSVVAPGSRGPVTGTNPLAYAIPTPDDDPIFLDIAISTVAGGRVYAARQLGRPIPSDWIVDRQGHATTDATLYPHNAALTPMGGHKGYGIALLIEAFSSLLTGAAVAAQVGSWMFGDLASPTGHGAAFLAVDIAAVAGSSGFAARAQTLIDQVHAAPAAEGVDRVLLPGEREWARRRKALVDGIELPADVIEALTPMIVELGLNPFDLDHDGS